MKAYSAVDDLTFAAKLGDWHRVYADPDAVRGALRTLADLKKPITGEVVRLSDDAVEGAIKFMAKAGNGLDGAAREQLLRRAVEAGPDEAERLLLFVKESPSPQSVEGLAKYLQTAPCTIVP
jgi:hypothetical protein